MNKVLLTDGDWRIMNNNIVPGNPYLQHRCPIGRGEWGWFTSVPSKSCGKCTQNPPDGLIVSLMFLEVGE